MTTQQSAGAAARPGSPAKREPGRDLVLVSGSPGSGKTSLAVPLAAELGFTLLGKDRIKEVLHDALAAEEPEPDLAWSRRLGAAAMELLWALAVEAPAVVLDANFSPDDPGSRPGSGVGGQPGRGALHVPAAGRRPPPCGAVSCPAPDPPGCYAGPVAGSACQVRAPGRRGAGDHREHDDARRYR